jgi:cytochrome P450
MELFLHFRSYHLLVLGVFAFFLHSLLGVVRRAITRRRFIREHGCRPPANLPVIDPIFGLDQLRGRIIDGRRHVSLEKGLERFNRYGDTYAVRMLDRWIILTRQPENIKAILSINFKEYSLGAGRLRSFAPLLGKGIFTTDGEDWAHSRAMIRPNFVRDQIAELSLFEDLITDLFALIPRDGTTVDLQDLFFAYTIDSATEFLFGNSVQSLKEKRSGQTSKDDFAGAFNYAQKAIVDRARLGPLSRFYSDPQAAKCEQICKAMVDQFVQDAVNYRQATEDVDEKHHGKRKYLFLHGLASQTSDKHRMRDELMNVLLAGRDTTAGLLSNLFFMLAKHPDIWAKLRHEITTSLNGRLPTYEELRNLRYLKYCLNECLSNTVPIPSPFRLYLCVTHLLTIIDSALRLHPVVPVNNRTSITDTVLPVGGGPNGKFPVFVPKNTVVAYSVHAMHRREDFYGPDANEFRPERWEHLRPSWEYLPFNGGPRICPGQQYALTEAGYVTVRLAQEFKTLESRDPGPWVESLTLTLASHNGTKVGLIPADEKA